MNSINSNPSSSSFLDQVNTANNQIQLLEDENEWMELESDIDQVLNESDDVNEQEEVVDLESYPALIQKLLEENSCSQRLDFLRNNSIVNNIPNELSYKVNIRLLAMLFGDKIIGSSSLEGYKVEENVKFILHILNSSKTLPNFDKTLLIKELTDFKSICSKLEGIKTEKNAKEFIQSLKTRLNNLPLGERILFEGGWKSPIGGHFILYEFIKTTKGFDLNFYNTGAGIQYHASKKLNEKEYINPVFTISNIAPERVCSEAILTLIVFMNTREFTSKKSSYISDRDIYESLTKILDGQCLIPSNAQWVTPQYSGTCSSKALIAFLKNRIPQEFSELLFQVKFWCLTNYVHDKDTIENRSEALLLKKAIHGLANLARKIYAKNRLKENSNIEPQELDCLLHLHVLNEKIQQLIEKSTPDNQAPLVKSKISCQFKLVKLDEFDSRSDIVETSSSSSSSALSETPKVNSTTQKTSTKSKKTKKVIPPVASIKVPSHYLNDNAVNFFKEWLTFFNSLKKSPYISLAVQNFEEMMYRLPFELDLSDYTIKNKRELFHTLSDIAKTYLQNSLDFNRVTVSINLWHIFMLMGKVCKEVLSHEIPSINFELYGFKYRLPPPDFPRIACYDLNIQHKLYSLSNYLNNHQNKYKFFLFDTLDPEYQTTAFIVDEKNYLDFSDFNFIKSFIENPNYKKSKNTNILEDILSHYSSSQKKGLPKIYYDLRQFYFTCLLSMDFSNSFSLKNIINTSIKYDKCLNTLSTYVIKFVPKSIRNGDKVYFPRLLIAFNDGWDPDSISFFDPGTFVNDILNTAVTQNGIRSISKRSLTSKLEFDYTDDEISAISKHEINKIVDIYHSPTEKLRLCLNYYKENPLLLEKNIHRNFFGFVFYEFGALYKNLEVNFNLYQTIQETFKKLITLFKQPEPNHYTAVQFLYSLVLDYLRYYPENELLNFVKTEAINLYYLSNTLNLPEEGFKFKRHLIENVIKVLALSSNLSKEEAALALELVLQKQAIISEHLSTLENTSMWSKQTSGLLFKLNDILADPSKCNEILPEIRSLKQNLDSSIRCTWIKEKGNEYHYSCQGWTFDLFSGKFTHPDHQKLSAIMEIKIGGGDYFGETSIFKIIGKSYSKLILNKGVWSDPENTIRLFKTDKGYEITQVLNNEWQKFCFYSQGLHQPLPGLPKSFNPKFKCFAKRKKSYSIAKDAQEDIFWYQPLHSKGGMYYGKNREDKIIYHLSRIENGSWMVEDTNTHLVYASLDKCTLSSYLEPITHFPEELKKQMQVWLNKNSKEIGRIVFKDFDNPFTLLDIYKQNDDFLIKGYDDLKISTDPSQRIFKTLPPYLQVVDSKQKRYVFIPRVGLRIEAKGENNDPFHLKHVMNISTHFLENYQRHIKPLEASFVLYEYNDKINELTSIDLLSNIYLCYLCFVDQNYEKAFDLLEKCKQSNPYTPAQYECFDEFFLYTKPYNYLVAHPLQSAILVKIQSMIIESIEFSSNKKTTLLSIPLQSLKKYFQLYNAIPEKYRVQTNQEIAVIDHILSIKENGKCDFIEQIKIFLLNKKSNPRFELSKFKTFIEINFQRFNRLDLPLNKITGLELKAFDYKKELQLLRNQPSEKIWNPNEIIVSNEMIFAMFLGILSDSPEISSLCCSRLFFLRGGLSSSNFNHYSFLIILWLEKNKFREYLKQKNIVLSSANPTLEQAQTVLEAWWNYVSENNLSPESYTVDVLNIPIEYDNKTSEFIPNRVISAISSPDPIANSKQILPDYKKNIAVFILDLEYKRINIGKQFFTTHSLKKQGSLLFSHPNSNSKKLLDTYPLATEMYHHYREVNVNGIKRVLNNPNKSDLFTVSNNLLTLINSTKNSLITESLSLKNILEKEVNTTPLEEVNHLTIQGLQRALERKIDVLSYQKSPLTIQDMVVLILADEWESLTQKNPFLAERDRDILLKKTIEYMIVESEIDLYSKIEKEVQDLLIAISQDKSMDTAPFFEHIGGLIDTRRHFDPQKKPHFLAFEYLTHIVLRKQQVEKIEQCLNSKNTHQILKLLMGEGKTKVILPFLSKMLSDGFRLPIVIAPHSLYEEYIINLKAVAEQNLSQKVFTFTFSRSSSTATNETVQILNMLKRALSDKGVVLITAETIKSLFLKYQELLVLEEVQGSGSDIPAGELKDRRSILGDIINLIRNCGFALIDEGHLALKSLTEMNFTLSTNDNLSKSEIVTVLKIYKALTFINFNFTAPLAIDLADEENGSFSAERNLLIEQLYSGSNEGNVKEYLKGKNPSFIDEIRSINPELANELALIKEEVWKLLPFTLSRALNHRYGRNLHNPDVEHAIPYIGSQKPSPLSEFGHKFVLINYTIQMHLQEGLTKHQFKVWIQGLKKKWMNTLVKTSEEEADQVVQKFLKNVSLKQLNLNDDTILSTLFKTYGKSQDIVFDYLENDLLPKLNFHNKKLNSNEQDLGDFLFPIVIALSGTPYNAKTYPQEFHKIESNSLLKPSPIAESTKLSDEDKHLLIALSQPLNKHITVVENESSKSALNAISQVYKTKKEGQVAAFIDLGAYFKDYSNLQTAKMILELLESIEAVVFFDDMSNKLSCLRKGSSTPEGYFNGKIKSDKIFAFFDNIHIFAADIVLGEQAHGIVSLNQESCLYELFQAAKRMRKLEKSQSISYLISNTLKSQLTALTDPEPFGVDSIYIFALLNQAKLVNKEIELSTFHQLKHQVKKDYLDKQLDSRANLGLASKILIENNNFNPSGHYSRKISPKELFKNYCNSLALTPVGKFKKPDQPWSQIIEKATLLLPKEVDCEGGANLGLEIEKQEEKRIEQFVDKINAFEPHNEYTTILFSLICSRPIAMDLYSTFNTFFTNFDYFCCYTLNNYLSIYEGKNIEIFTPNILITQNFAKTSAINLPQWDIPIKPVDYFVQLLYPNNNGFIESYYLILSLYEVESMKVFINSLKYLQLPYKPYVTLYTIQGDYVNGDNIVDRNNEDFKRALVQMKYFDGREDYSKAEENTLRNWLQGKEIILTELFAKLHQNREKNDDFGNGLLFKIINENSQIQHMQICSHLESQNPIYDATSNTRKRKEPEESGMEVDVEPLPKAKKHKT